MLHHLLGDLQLDYFLAAFFYAIFGTLISLLYHAANRKPSSPSSPETFKWGYLFGDNKVRIVLNILVILMCIRFCPQIFGIELTMWQATLIGLGLDRILALLKNKGFLDSNA